jgi:propanol-preferring alcohol dehydrogenase
VLMAAHPTSPTNMAPQIPKTQKAAVYHEHKGPLKIEDVPVVQPKDLKPDEALVKIHYSGVCHTDLHAWLGDWPMPNKLPLIGGHEGAGEIVAIGESSTTSLKVGDRVGIKWLADSCLECEFCRKGYEPLCVAAKCSGYTVDGTFQQYAVSYTRALSRIPDNLSYQDAAPILCAGLTVYKALKESGAVASDWVVIPGAGGGLGHLAVQYATSMGLRVVAIDTGDEKRDLVKKLGADAWLDFKQEKDIVKAVQNVTPDGLGAHAAIVAAAGAAAYEQALKYIRPHGTVVIVGLPPGKLQADIFWTVLKSKRIVGSYVGNRQDATEALALAAAGRVKTLYKMQPLGEISDVYHEMEEGTMAGRIVLDLQK